MSDKSEACPLCGAPVADNLETPTPISKEEHISLPKKKNSYWIFIGIIVIALITLAIVFIMGRNGKEHAVQEQEPIEQRIDQKKPKASIHHFAGTVADVGVHMSMIIDETSVRGKCYYDSQGKKENTTISIYGTNDNNHLELTESFNGHATGTYKGDLSSPVYKGIYTRKKDGKVFTFYLVEAEGGNEFYNENELGMY